MPNDHPNDTNNTEAMIGSPSTPGDSSVGVKDVLVTTGAKEWVVITRLRRLMVKLLGPIRTCKLGSRDQQIDPFWIVEMGGMLNVTRSLWKYAWI